MASALGLHRLADAVAPPRLGTPFRRLLGSSWTSNLADGLALAAAPLLVASSTDQPFLVGLAVLLQKAPWLVFGLYAGVVADRVDRRRLVVAGNLSRAALLAGLAAAIAGGAANVVVVLAALTVLGTLEVFTDTTSHTLMPMLVGSDDLPIANARLMFGFATLNQLAGPPVGAALFALGAPVPFAVQAACFAVAALSASGLRLPPHGVDKADRGRARHELAEGLRWLRHHAAMRTLAITIVTFNVTYGAAWSVLVLYATERLGTGEIGFGLLMAVLAVGGILGTLVYGRLAAHVRLGDIMRIGLLIETATHLVLAATAEVWVAAVTLFVFGVHAAVWATTSISIRQRAVPRALQGRVGSAYMIGVQGGIVVGAGLGGVIADVGGVTAPFWFAFVGSAFLVAVLWRQLTHVAHSDAAA